MAPAGVIRPILCVPFSVNHRAPSGPVVIPMGVLDGARGNVVTLPAGVIRPITAALVPSTPVNQRAPSGPEVMSTGRTYRVEFTVGKALTTRPGVIRPMLLPPLLRSYSVNQRASSGPVAMRPSRLLTAPLGCGTANSVMVPAVVIRPILSTPLVGLFSVNHSAPSGPSVMSLG